MVFVGHGTPFSVIEPNVWHDHFLPLLYALGLVEPDGPVETFCEGFQWPGISMRSVVLA